eukprot:m.325616 g.325616  ORF g.325616 m.325616 type:complete len:629 (-) comp19735_c0_seq21:94-1980(-)
MRVAVFLLVAFAAVATCAAAKPGSKPSFLFILGDDIGWADFGYNNGTAFTPNLDAWATAEGSILMQDMHSGGTVCSPTRATVLTGRNHFRDCVDYVYGCSDMTECVPSFEFAPQHTFTIGDAARAAGSEYSSFFGGKWHLGSFYNDSEKLGGRTSSPISHGFDHMNATVEVAPTATTNCQCRQDWDKECLFGHYKKPTHCSGGANPGGGSLPRGCCFNYWWEDQEAEHGVTNLTNFVPQDDSQYTHSSFVKFIDSIDGNPFLAQLSFHNCHIPFIGTEERRQACAQNKTCKPPLPGSQPYTDEELDFYACISELDNAIGDVLQLLKDRGYCVLRFPLRMIWLATDNGPEENCHPEGICKGTEHRPQQGAGSAGPLRGRKRDIWEGGHRVPGLVSWPAMVQGSRVSWDTVVTYDFLPTVMEVLGVERPASQSSWAMDGRSIMPIIKGEAWPLRGLGWMFDTPKMDVTKGYGFRYGKWKYVQGSISCSKDDCRKPQLYDLDADLGERNDVSAQYPEVLQAMMANFSKWHASILDSMVNESECKGPLPPPPPAPPAPPSSDCSWTPHAALNGTDLMVAHAATKESCCGACANNHRCKAADFDAGNKVCHLKEYFQPKTGPADRTACVPNKR